MLQGNQVQKSQFVFQDVHFKTNILYLLSRRNRFPHKDLNDVLQKVLQPFAWKGLTSQHYWPELGFGTAALKTLKQNQVYGYECNSCSCANSKTKIASLLLQPCRSLNDNKAENLQWIQGASLLWNFFGLVKEKTNKSLTPEVSHASSRSVNIQCHSPLSAIYSVAYFSSLQPRHIKPCTFLRTADKVQFSGKEGSGKFYHIPMDFQSKKSSSNELNEWKIVLQYMPLAFCFLFPCGFLQVWLFSLFDIHITLLSKQSYSSILS